MEEVFKPWYPLKEVREKVFSNELSIGTIQNMCKKGEIPYTKFGGRKIFIPGYWVKIKLNTGRGEANA